MNRGPSELSRPSPRVPISIRAASRADLPFIDDLQKQHSRMLGFMHRKTLEGYIESGDVLIAEGEASRDRGNKGSREDGADSMPSPLGYAIARDRYFKREDVGIIYQVAVVPAPEIRRSLIGASLVQAMFEKAAYGCKLFCAWCAQDLEANRFWESLGFVPLAFRTGSGKTGRERIHIFWQKRIREDDHETPYWFPSQTSGGAIREDRLVIPIPPGTHWSDAKPVLLPEIPGVERFLEDEGMPGSSSPAKRKGPRRRKPRLSAAEKRSSHSGGLWFGPSPEEIAEAERQRKAKKPRTRKKYHPKYVAAARELCALYLEELQAGRCLPEGEAQGKYDITRSLPHPRPQPRPRNLEAARLVINCDETKGLLDAA